jgi:DNA-binding HxlR family transcriptional regulator
MILNTNTRSLIVQAIRSLPEWFTIWQLSEATGGTCRKTLTSQLARMVNHGEIERGNYAKGLPKGKAFRFYRATERLGESVGKTYGVCYRVAIEENQHNIFVELIERGHDEDFIDREPAESTSAAPGSPEKVEVMRRRVERGEALCHPCDNRQILVPNGSEPSEVEPVSTRIGGRVMRKRIGERK